MSVFVKDMVDYDECGIENANNNNDRLCKLVTVIVGWGNNDEQVELAMRFYDWGSDP